MIVVKSRDTMGPILVHIAGDGMMKQVTIAVEDNLYEFYRKVGQSAGGLSTEQVMSDALLKLAGELSLDALGKSNDYKNNT